MNNKIVINSVILLTFIFLKRNDIFMNNSINNVIFVNSSIFGKITILLNTDIFINGNIFINKDIFKNDIIFINRNNFINSDIFWKGGFS